MKLNKQDIKEMAVSCVKLLLEAITTQDAYGRFYAEYIPENTWKTLISGTTNMTPFHKKIADAIVKNTKINTKNGDKKWATFSQAVDACAKLAATCWNNEKARNFLLNSAMEDYPVYSSSLSNIRDFLTGISQGERFSENEFLTDSLYLAYEDETLKVTVTLSYTASHTNYGDSHWCTASDPGGRWNGYYMFCDYARCGKAVWEIGRASCRERV